ncbi:hypothetical protein CCR94_12665 [Rhodoblastus sphagnicola]|uniref:Uncharacterized protein n=1 Tax=Rhodoblastus sphagnicola TaxID=333368 RepID=A0A2S6N6Y2_9HYPH|nr:hypothetical protein CCR94_12665 [Rhodoblastus sphagnicola]
MSNPGLETISSGLSSADSASAARASLDSKYAAMAASGQPFDVNSPEGKDWYTAFGSLDRNALNAAMNNQGGLFTKQEQDIAQSIMSQQQGLAMGLYSGPSSQASKFVDPFAGQDSSARMKAGAKWLDQVSNDEKKTVAWAFSRASAQTSYKNSGSAAADSENLNSDSPLVSLIASAMNTMSSAPSRSYTIGNVTTISDLLAQPWFMGFTSQLNGAIEQTQNLYS